MRSPALEFGHSKFEKNEVENQSSRPAQRWGEYSSPAAGPWYQKPTMSSMSSITIYHHSSPSPPHEHPTSKGFFWSVTACSGIEWMRKPPRKKLNISISNTGVLWTRKWLFQPLGCLSIDSCKATERTTWNTKQELTILTLGVRSVKASSSSLSRSRLKTPAWNLTKHLIPVQHLRFTQIYNSLESPSQHLLGWLLVLHSCNFDPGVCVAVAHESRASRAHWRHLRHRFGLFLSASQSSRIRLLSGPESESLVKSLEKMRWVEMSCIEGALKVAMGNLH